MRPRALIYFYSRRLRVHGIQELLAGLGMAIAVALVFAVTVASSSVSGSARQVVRAVVGPADLQLHARSTEGFDEHLLSRVERLPGVKESAPLLEVSATLVGRGGRRAAVELAGTDLGLALLDGLVRTLPIGTLTPGGLGLSKATAAQLDIHSRSQATKPAFVSVLVGGRATRMAVSAVLGQEAAGALSQAQVAVMPLSKLQRLAGARGRVSRILVASKPGQHAAVQRELEGVAGGKLTVAAADQDVALLNQALRPSNQASALFAALSALLGFLFAFNAMLLTVPERREAIADLRLDGTSRSTIVQLALFEALVLGVIASVVGLVGGYALSKGAFHESPGYLTRAFTLSAGTVIELWPIALSFAGGVLASCLASLVPLQDLRRGRPVDAALSESDGAGLAGSVRARSWLGLATVGLVLAASVLLAVAAKAAIVACALLALGTMLAVPLALGGVLGAASALAEHSARLTVLPLALASLRATSVRSLALAATGAVALFGSVALGGSRDDLLRGIDQYTGNYAGAADVWLVNPKDNQATQSISSASYESKLRAVAGVASVRTFRGGFLDVGERRAWLIAWPADTPRALLRSQIIAGGLAHAERLLGEPGSITVSDQIADEHHVSVGGTLTLPTPAGQRPFKVVATTTNFGWSPGAILMSARDYEQDWGTKSPSALGVYLKPGASSSLVRDAIIRALGPSSGLEVLTAPMRESTIEASASEGLSQLGEIANLLVAAAILAMAAALGASVWQRRVSLAELRLEGAPRRQLRLVLLVEAAIMLGAGCATGALAGVYGQIVIDGYLKRVAGFPVAGVASAQRPVEILALVVAAVLAIVAVPTWIASKAPPALALGD